MTPRSRNRICSTARVGCNVNTVNALIMSDTSDSESEDHTLKAPSLDEEKLRICLRNQAALAQLGILTNIDQLTAARPARLKPQRKQRNCVADLPTRCSERIKVLRPPKYKDTTDNFKEMV